MAHRKIVWTKTARIQRRSILEYWAKRNKSFSYPQKLSQLIKRRTHELAEYPEMGKEANFHETRVISLGHFSIFYKIFDEEIIISSFWDSRQDPKTLRKLLETKNKN